MNLSKSWRTENVRNLIFNLVKGSTHATTGKTTVKNI